MTDHRSNLSALSTHVRLAIRHADLFHDADDAHDRAIQRAAMFVHVCHALILAAPLRDADADVQSAATSLLNVLDRVVLRVEHVAADAGALRN